MEHLLPLFMGRGMASSKAKDPRQRPDAPSLAELKRVQTRLHDQIDGVERRERHQTERVPSGI